MRLTKTLVTLCLMFIITVAFVALTQKQRNTIPSSAALNGSTESAVVNSIQYNLWTFPASPTLLQPLYSAYPVPTANVAEAPATALGNSTRTEIYEFVKANPGVPFRGICNELGLSIGLAQFHLGVLTRTGLVSFFRDGKYKRFFVSKQFSKKQMKFISALRHETAGSILTALLKRREVSHGDLAHELSITSQGLTWHMTRLKKAHLVAESKENKKLLYSIQCTSAPLLTEMAKLLKQT